MTVNSPLLADPPPPYPARSRRTRLHQGYLGHDNDNDSQETTYHTAPPGPDGYTYYYYQEHDSDDIDDQISQYPYSHAPAATETTSFLPRPHPHPHRPRRTYQGPAGIPSITTSPSRQRPIHAPLHLHAPAHAHAHTHTHARITGNIPPALHHRSSFSRSSSISAAPSLAHTVRSLFDTDGDWEDDGWCLSEDSDGDGDGDSAYPGYGATADERVREGSDDDDRDDHGLSGAGGEGIVGRPKSLFNRKSWKKYWRPTTRKVYYLSFLHLAVINFPFALGAWVWLFAFTVAGTTLLVALPLGFILCFVSLLSARAFARLELAMQYACHRPLAYPSPDPPRPIFTRWREATERDDEGMTTTTPMVTRERSFYKNTYAMFTDPTSYQALFYFLVVKPAIALVLVVTVVAVGVPMVLLVGTAPAALRACRRLGRWQANIAVEGLYLAVR